MSQTLHPLFKFGGMLTVLLSTSLYSASKASAQSLLPDIHLFDGGQVCLALCTSPRSTTPSQATFPLSNQGLGALPAQVMQLPNQVLQLPQQMLSPQGSPGLRPNLPATPSNGPTLPPGNLPTLQGSAIPGMPPGAPLPPGNPQVMPQPVPQSIPQSVQSVPAQASRPGFLQKIAPVLPVLIQQLAK